MTPQQQALINSLQQTGTLGAAGLPSYPSSRPAPPKPKPVMPEPNVTETWASWLMLATGGLTWLAVLITIAIWRVDVSDIALTMFLGATSAGLWLVRRHELHERRRAYMADVMASQ